MRNIVMLGMQGSGKGTQAELLGMRLGIPAISTGRLFRAEMERPTGLGRVISKYVERGEMVPSDIVIQAIEDRVAEEDAEHGFILDGFPRSVEQAEALAKFMAGAGMHLSDVVYLRISDKDALRRLSGRRVCSKKKCEASYHVEFNPPKEDAGKCDRCGSPLVQRTDDTPEAIQRRIAAYHLETEPLIDYYHERGLLRDIDGERTITEVEKAIIEAVGFKQE